MKPTFYLMMGLPGSGKSTFAQKLSEMMNKSGWKTVIHSSDALREELFEDAEDQSHNNELFEELHKRIKNDLRRGINVIYDATNINKKGRIRFLKSIEKIKCRKECYCMATPYETCLVRNRGRDRRVPEDVIKNMYMKWSPPYYDEGFDWIEIVYDNPAKSYEEYRASDFIGHTWEYDQKNHFHELSLGKHCYKAAEYISRNHPGRLCLIRTALIHDNGKLFTQTNINRKGEYSSECHYYMHKNVGAYNALFYGSSFGMGGIDTLYMANLIYFHMRPLRAQGHSNALQNLRNKIGDGMYEDLMILHEADKYADGRAHENEIL